MRARVLSKRQCGSAVPMSPQGVSMTLRKRCPLACGCASRPSISGRPVRTSDAGTRAARSRSTHSAAGRAAKAASSSGISASRFPTRCAFVAKRGSAASSGRSRTSQSRVQRRWLSALTAT